MKHCAFLFGSLSAMSPHQSAHQLLKTITYTRRNKARQSHPYALRPARYDIAPVQQVFYGGIHLKA